MPRARSAYDFRLARASSVIASAVIANTKPTGAPRLAPLASHPPLPADTMTVVVSPRATSLTAPTSVAPAATTEMSAAAEPPSAFAGS